jgi:hypothetical protein
MIATTLLLAALPNAFASSHREAPGIALDPAADITDFYMFVSPEDSSKIVFLMNVNPLELPNGGPNFHFFDDNVMYQINIDNEGDGEEDIVFQFQTQTEYNIPQTFLYNDGYYFNAPNTQIDGYEDVNIAQTYTLTRVDDGVSAVIGGGDVAPINVGERSVVAGGYYPEDAVPGSITTAHTYTAGSYRYFAGPRQEGFYVDLGHTFDLLGVGVGTNTNSLLGYNVHTIAIEVDADLLTRDGAAPSAADKNQVIAAWATTSRRAVTVRRPDGKTGHRGPWVQVGRLGNPLVNEAVIAIADKDLFNATHPSLDAAYFLSYVTDPLLPVYMNVVLGTYLPSEAEADIVPSVIDTGLDTGGREDLVAAFLTGFVGFGNIPEDYYFGATIPGESKSFSAFEAMRLNIAGEGAGYWPDGRAVGDDVVDTALFALAGGVLGLSGAVPDGVDSTGLHYLDTFPFLGDPWAGGVY